MTPNDALNHLLKYKGVYAALHDLLSSMVEDPDCRPLPHLSDITGMLVTCVEADEKFSTSWSTVDECVELLRLSLNAWEDEEDSVQEEHAELIERIRKCLNPPVSTRRRRP